MANHGAEMGRRAFAASAAAAAAAVAVSSVLTKPVRGAEPSPEADGGSLAGLAANCVRAGEACLSHCFMMFESGDTSLAACARSVHEMMPVCTALERLAQLQSSHLKVLSQACEQVCDACQKECEKHAELHEECRKCAEACEALVAALRSNA